MLAVTDGRRIDVDDGRRHRRSSRRAGALPFDAIDISQQVTTVEPLVFTALACSPETASGSTPAHVPLVE